MLSAVLQAYSPRESTLINVFAKKLCDPPCFGLTVVGMVPANPQLETCLLSCLVRGRGVLAADQSLDLLSVPTGKQTEADAVILYCRVN